MSRALLELPMLQMPHEANCGNCTAACCSKGMKLCLTKQEADFLRQRSTLLKEESDIPVSVSMRQRAAGQLLRLCGQQPPEKPMWYTFETDCGNLREDQETKQLLCAAFNDERKPVACGQYIEGGYMCRQLRSFVGIDTEEQFQIYKAYTEEVS